MLLSLKYIYIYIFLAKLMQECQTPCETYLFVLCGTSRTSTFGHVLMLRMHIILPKGTGVVPEKWAHNY